MGKGGMGTILEARDTLLNLDVAMKVMAIDNTGINAARLQREAIACGNLRHSGIARIYEFGQTPEGSPYMVMELFVGLNLAQYLEEYDLLPYQAALPILRQIANALEFAHKNGVVHRDLKPSNIMLIEQMTGEFQVKLLDFGVAQTQQQSKTLTATGAMIGSPLYASPEQAQSENLDHRTDIYSFGCLMYECLSGKPPFLGNSALETIALHKKAKPAQLSTVMPPNSIPIVLAELVDKCLQKEKEKRPQNMQEIADILTSLETNIDNLALNIPIVYSKRKWVFITLAGCLITSVCWIIYSNQTIKPVVVNAIKQKASKSPSTNWEALRNYRQGFDKNLFQIIERDGIKIAENCTEEIGAPELKALAKLKFQGVRLIGFSSPDGLTDALPVKEMRILELENSKIKNSCLKEIGTMTNLNTLLIDSPNITDNGMTYLNELKSLELLTLNCPELTDEGLIKLNLTKLKTITLLSPNISGSGLISLVQSPIVHARFACSSMRPDIGLILNQFTKLKYLEFSGVNLSKESLEAISKNEPMALKLKDTTLSSEDFDAISKMNSLFQLDLNDTPVTEENLKKLSKLKKLYFLDLSGYRKISNEMMDIICSLKITRLDLSHTSIMDHQLRQLIKSKSLEHLVLKDCEKLSDDSVADFIRDFKNINNKTVTVKASDLFDSKENHKNE